MLWEAVDMGCYGSEISTNEILRGVIHTDPNLKLILSAYAAIAKIHMIGMKEVTLAQGCRDAYENQDIFDPLVFSGKLRLLRNISLNEVLQIHESAKSDPQFLLFVRKLHFVFGKDAIKVSPKNGILPGITKNHRKVRGKNIAVRHVPMLAGQEPLYEGAVQSPQYSLEIQHEKHVLVECIESDGIFYRLETNDELMDILGFVAVSIKPPSKYDTLRTDHDDRVEYMQKAVNIPTIAIDESLLKDEEPKNPFDVLRKVILDLESKTVQNSDLAKNLIAEAV